MPRIIWSAKLEKLLRLPELLTFLNDYREMTGLELSFRDGLGRALVPESPGSPLCQRMACTDAGRKFCQRTRQALFCSAANKPAVCRCDAGLFEVAVPVRVLNTTIGFFLAYGFRPGELKPVEHHRIRHLLAKSGVRIPDTDLQDLYAGSKSTPESAIPAHQRLVGLAISEFSHQISKQVMHPERPLAPLAHRARKYIQTHAYTEHCGVAQIARGCGVSPAHLSRAFHKSTGLTVIDYLARFRVANARSLLERHEHSITEIAFACGFQSISQFNRTFKKVEGCPPSHIRAGHRPGQGMPEENLWPS
jgi:AraC-like DNA-binding protein